LGDRGQSDLDRAAFEKLQDYFARVRPVPAAYLFGSRATGGYSVESDLDVAIILPGNLGLEDAFWECADIKDALETLFRPLKVDVLDLERVPCRIAHEILKTGILIVQNDEGRRVAVETRRQSEYLDFLPRIQYYRKEVLGFDRPGTDARRPNCRGAVGLAPPGCLGNELQPLPTW